MARRKLSARQRYLRDAATCQRYAAITHDEMCVERDLLENHQAAIAEQLSSAKASALARYYLFSALDLAQYGRVKWLWE